MNILNAGGLSFSFGARELFSGASFEVGERDKVGLVGANGTGKTTLFKLIRGELTPDSGGFAFSKGLNIGTMEQFLTPDTGRSALEEALTVFEGLIKTETELQALTDALLDSSDTELIQRHLDLHEEFERQGGLTFRARTRSALLGLGFFENELKLPVSALSGGQRSKLSLAKLLLSGAQLLLLDEPTNHLDIHSVQWLEDFLLQNAGAYIVISHDRYFLDRVTTRTIEIENGRLRSGNGGYTKYTEQKKLDLEIEEKHYNLQIKEIERLEGIITKFRQFNREKSIKQAESREKQLEKLKAELITPPSRQKNLSFSFKSKSAGPTEVLHAKNMAKAYDRILYGNADVDLYRGDRAFLLGKNGCGKTTLLRQIMAGREEGHDVFFGPGVQVGYYEQGQESLNPDKTALDEVWDAHRNLSETAVRCALAAFLFRQDDIYKKVGDLSGGERARIAILKLMLSGCNLLFLDEPTNHLDLYSREALERALIDFGGTLLIVSHDRYFINKLATKILRLTVSGIEAFDGDYDSYIQKTALTAESSRAEGEKPSGGGTKWAMDKQRRSEMRKLQSKLSRTEEEIRAVEESTQRLRGELLAPEVAADYEKALEITNEIERLCLREEELIALWEELEEKIGQE